MTFVDSSWNVEAMQLIEIGAGILPCVVILVCWEPRESAGVVPGAAKGVLSETAEPMTDGSPKGEVECVRELMATRLNLAHEAERRVWTKG
ncbi:MAG: hypothetical protein JWQ49_3091 [Edaphobacter sp.]|nr:hypothetical protein [Edaphobacter sp.]